VNLKRVRHLKVSSPMSGPVGYWMSRDQRARDNWALFHAQQQALQMKLPLQVVFVLVPQFLSAQSTQYSFMLKGLEEVAVDLAAKNISFKMLAGDPVNTLVPYVREKHVSLLVTDFDPLRIKREWKVAVMESCAVFVDEVDTHNIVPCWEASTRMEFGAYTPRPKIHRQLIEYLEPLPELVRHPYSDSADPYTLDWVKISAPFAKKNYSETLCVSGQTASTLTLSEFITNGLERYGEDRNDPARNGQSSLSPYIHFGQLSAQRIFMEITAARTTAQSKAIFLEEFLVRRELADNFCYYNPNYDNTKGFPAWAQKTLEEHLYDDRPYLYDRETLEACATHDPAWNGAQRQLTTTGKMHGYMRMYWGKKILEWSRDPETAMQTAIYLNDHYSLDGRDPNGYAGIAWCIGGVHDRAWSERAVFGKIRYMNYAGLKRKFKIEHYTDRYQ